MILKKGLLCLLLCMGIFSFSVARAEIKVFEKETIWRAARNQSQEQAEGLAKLEAQRQAIEEAGVFISSLTVVKNYKLEKDEITQLASGILNTKSMGEPTIYIDNGILCVRVKTVIQVDTTILDRQIETFMKDKGALKREEEALKKVRELQDQLTNLKSTELKRLEELNAQALAMERERNKHRLFREEQALKARGELNKAEADRIAKQREIQDRISRRLALQEKARREEATAMAAEQDRIKRAQMENEQRWNDLARRVKLSQESWFTIDDSLSFKQAVEEVKGLKADIANLKNRLDFQYEANTANLKKAYDQQRNLMKAKFPQKPPPRDAFEKTAEYNQRISVYERQVEEAEATARDALKKLQKEETLKIAEAKEQYLGQQIRMLTPFVERLGSLQARKFSLPEEGSMTIDLGEPDADNNRFPVNLRFKDKSWSAWWNYTERNSAKNFYQTRISLKVEGLFQIEEGAQLSPKLTAAKVTHMAMQDTREFTLGLPITISEIDQLAVLKQEEAPAAYSRKKAAKMLTLRETGRDGRFIAFDDGTILDAQNNLMWASKDNGSNINWINAKSYCENYRGGGYSDWRMPTLDELKKLYDRNKEFRIVTDLINLTDYYVWASEIMNLDDSAKFFLFGTGREGWSKQSNVSGFRTLPVRTDNAESSFSQKKQTEKASREEGLPNQKEIRKDGRFITYDDGTILDAKTNLMWAAKDNASDINWADAKSYCENYRGGGYSDWRMPTLDDLALLFASDTNKDQIERTSNFHWASETRGSEAALFHLFSGKRLWDRQDKNISYRALPMRSNQKDESSKFIQEKPIEQSSPEVDFQHRYDSISDRQDISNDNLKPYPKSVDIAVPVNTLAAGGTARIKTDIVKGAFDNGTILTNSKKTKQQGKQIYITSGIIKAAKFEGNNYLRLTLFSSKDKNNIIVWCSGEKTRAYAFEKEVTWSVLTLKRKIKVSGSWIDQGSERVLWASRIDLL